jgi:hypothetical protein
MRGTKNVRPEDTSDVDDLVDTFSRRVRVCDCGTVIPTDEKSEIDVCWAWLEQSHPTVFKNITYRGHPNSSLFRAYVFNVYRGMRLVRPDVVAPFSTTDSIAGNCRAFRRIVDMFPCLFE